MSLSLPANLGQSFSKLSSVALPFRCIHCTFQWCSYYLRIPFHMNLSALKLSEQHNEGGGQETQVWNCQIWRCPSHAASKSGLWPNILLNVCAFIMHATHKCCTLCYLILIEIFLGITYINYNNILVECRNCNGKLHTILDVCDVYHLILNIWSTSTPQTPPIFSEINLIYVMYNIL